MKRANVLKTIIANGKRYITLEVFRKDNHKAKQYSPGGFDYCPPVDIQALVAAINNNRADSSVIAYRDKIVQISKSGELRLYGTADDGITLLGSIHFKNDGNAEINTPELLKTTAKNTETTVTAKHKITATNIEFNGITDITGNTKVTGALEATGSVKAGNGATGTFTTSVTVLNGIVTGGT